MPTHIPSTALPSPQAGSGASPLGLHWQAPHLLHPGGPCTQDQPRSAGTRRGAPTSEPLTLNQRGGAVTHGPGGEAEAQSMSAHHLTQLGSRPRRPLPGAQSPRRTGGDQAQGPSRDGDTQLGQVPAATTRGSRLAAALLGQRPLLPAGRRFPWDSPHPAPSTGVSSSPPGSGAGRLATVSGDRCAGQLSESRRRHLPQAEAGPLPRARLRR